MNQFNFYVSTKGMLSFTIEANDRDQAIEIARNYLGHPKSSSTAEIVLHVEDFEPFEVENATLEVPSGSDNWDEIKELCFDTDSRLWIAMKRLLPFLAGYGAVDLFQLISSKV